VLLGILTGSMFLVYLGLCWYPYLYDHGTHGYECSMYEIAESQLRCIDCDSTQVDTHAFVSGGTPVIQVTCTQCEVTRTLVEGYDE